MASRGLQEAITAGETRTYAHERGAFDREHAGRQSVAIAALRSGRSHLAVDGTVSNDAAGLAVDIARSGCGADLVRDLAAMSGPLGSTEPHLLLGSGRPSDPRAFARADHRDHAHVGWDG
jgi:hypothetical protein